MAKCTTPMQLLQAQTKRFKTAQGSMQDSLRQDAEAGVQVFIESVGGNVSTSTLRRMGHPFGRGTGPGKGNLKRGRLPGLPINAQTGILRANIRAYKTDKGAYMLGSSAPYAKYVLHPAGTSKMVSRTKNGRPLMTGRELGLSRIGLLEQRHRINTKARRLALKQAHRSI